MTALLLDGAGWLGGIIVAIVYALVVTERIRATGRAFQILNIVGGALLAVTALYRFALPNLIINVVWIGFGAYALLAARRKSTRPAEIRADFTDAHASTRC